MPESPPPGVFPIFLRSSTAEKYKLKTGDGVMDLVDFMFINKIEIMKDIQTMGVMCDFEPAKKQIESCQKDQILIVVDKVNTYSEMFLIYFTEESQNQYMKTLQDIEDAINLQKAAELEIEEAKKAAALLRQSIVYEDKPVIPRKWVSASSVETESSIRSLAIRPSRSIISIEITRPKKHLKQNNLKFSDKHGSAEFRAYKDPAFKSIRENDIGIQIAPLCTNSSAQTAWYRAVNKSVQYEATSAGENVQSSAEINNPQINLLNFLENATVRVERALQQNETIDIYHETFRLGDDDNIEGNQTENELREIKNFADPIYSKMKALVSIDWMPKSHGILAVSAIRNINYDQRVSFSGQTVTSHILVWDFRQLVKPIVLMQTQQEVLKFRFNKSLPSIVVGGCATGQVVLWDISDAMSIALRKNNRNNNNSNNNDLDEEELNNIPILPKYVSMIDHSHRKSVSDIFWLPSTTQLNYRGQLVGKEHLDGFSYQFITVSGDGTILVWDTRFEKIAAEELRHIGRMKHVPTEKSKDGTLIPLWAPIFRAQLKRLEGVGELSICRACGYVNSNNNDNNSFSGDTRSHILMTSEEGDIILADLSAKRAEINVKDDDDDDIDTGKDFIRWIATDHPRPTVALQQSPFFPDIYLSVGDWSFHIWKIGEDRPLFQSPISSAYLTVGLWSPTRPAVVIVATKEGQLLAWDFTDTSFKPSLDLKATHSRITSMEFLSSSSSSKTQLLAVGDDTGTLHVYEAPRILSRPIHKEETVMSMFLEREIQRNVFYKTTKNILYSDLINDSRNDDINMLLNNEEYKSNNADAEISVGSLNKDITKKEDEDFANLESQFLMDLGIKAEN